MRKIALALAALMISGSASAAPVIEGALGSDDTNTTTLGTLNVGDVGVSGESAFSPEFGSNLAAVPEPSTWAMMLAGFGVIGATSRRRVRSVRVSFA